MSVEPSATYEMTDLLGAAMLAEASGVAPQIRHDPSKNQSRFCFPDSPRLRDIRASLVAGTLIRNKDRVEQVRRDLRARAELARSFGGRS
jgi:hypothetical protein